MTTNPDGEEVQSDLELDGEEVQSDLELFDKIVEQDSDEMLFKMSRPPEPGTTFSREGMTGLARSIEVFISARIAARFKSRSKSEPGAHDIVVSVALTIDGETLKVPDRLMPWYALVDGDRRKGGLN